MLMLLNYGVREDSLRVPRTSRRSNQSILKEISPEYSLEGLMMKPKLQYFGHQLWKIYSLKIPWCWEGLKAGGEGDDKGWDGWMVSLTWWIWVWASSGNGWWTGKPGVLQFMGSQRVRHDWMSELNNSFLIMGKEPECIFKWVVKDKTIRFICTMRSICSW